MKNRILILVLSIMAIAGCDRTDGTFENRIFIDADDFANEVRVAVDEDVREMQRTMIVAMAQPLQHDLEISFLKSPELLDTYRQAYYDPEAELLPDGHCDISSLKAVIRAGEVSSDEITFDFVKLGEGEGLDYTKRYVLPVTIAAEGVEALPRAKTMYFVVRQAALVNVAADMASNNAWPEWGAFSKVNNMTDFTFEALINAHAFNNKSAVHTIMGIEDKFLLRVGDTGIPSGQIQLAYAHKTEDGLTYRGNITAANMQLATDRWYHLALTFDGGEDKTDGAEVKIYLDGILKTEGKCSVKVKDADTNVETTVGITSVDFMIPHSDEMNDKPRCFWVGYSYDSDRSFNGMMSEVRVWNRALTADEINAENHFYKLYPDAVTGEFPEDLIAYWKFNEEKGKTIKDWSVYGNDMTGDHDFVWYSVELPEK